MIKPNPCNQESPNLILFIFHIKIVSWTFVFVIASGSIPSQIQNMNLLAVLYLSNNTLTGFSTFDND